MSDRGFDELIEVVREELGNITKLKKDRETKMAPSLRPRVLGSIFHDFYNCCERIFKRLAGEINGGFYEGDRWHKELLYRMTLDVKGIRPTVVSESLAAELDDFLSFRHVFRNIYGFELRGDRIERLDAKFDAVADRFTTEIQSFLDLIS